MARTGRPSKFKGLRIFKLIDVNPRREGTLGHANWELIEDGMTYEEYKAAGGRRKDLQNDIDYGRIQVRYEQPEEY